MPRTGLVPTGPGRVLRPAVPLAPGRLQRRWLFISPPFSPPLVVDAAVAGLLNSFPLFES